MDRGRAWAPPATAGPGTRHTGDIRLDVRGISKRYRRHTVLDAVDLTRGRTGRRRGPPWGLPTVCRRGPLRADPPAVDGAHRGVDRRSARCA